MAVKMRLRRMGSRNAPFYRVVVQDARRATTGRFIESIGWYDPKQEGNNFSLNLSRVEYWRSSGAQASDTVASLIKKVHRTPVEKSFSREEDSEKVSASAIEVDVDAEENAALEKAEAGGGSPSTEVVEKASEKGGS